MTVIKVNLLLFLLNIFYVTDTSSLRRIKDGEEVSKDKRYVVYLVKAPDSARIYDEWLCGGALVSTLFIVTSAACVTDVEYMYAISGYKKYVTDANIETDECTKAMKKKVVYTCVPMKYEFDYTKTEKWSFIDIALVRVESPYQLDDDSYGANKCSYAPTVIPINYEQKFQKPGTDALVYGWGHLEKWRQADDGANYNSQTMRYAATKIMDKSVCKKHYEIFPSMTNNIDQYMICALTKGEINDKGELVRIGPEPPKIDGCATQQFLRIRALQKSELALRRNASVTDECEADIYKDLVKDETRRKDEKSNRTSSGSINQNRTVGKGTNAQSRKHGICQNDHGGPLVTWVGGNEVLIGVASVFKVSNDSKCMGPYLYTSTQCNGAFLDCVLSKSLPNNLNRRALCNSPPIQRGYDTVERNISWAHHPAGPADNERNTVNVRGREEKSPQALRESLRFAMLSKLAKDQSNAILRTQRLYRQRE